MVSTLLTFCPPLPPLRAVRYSISFEISTFICNKDTKEMRAVIQRVTHASVSISGELAGAISGGLLIFLGVEDRDTSEDVQWLSAKIVQLRIFPDAAGVMNVSVRESGGEIL